MFWSFLEPDLKSQVCFQEAMCKSCLLKCLLTWTLHTRKQSLKEQAKPAEVTLAVWDPSNRSMSLSSHSHAIDRQLSSPFPSA